MNWNKNIHGLTARIALMQGKQGKPIKFYGKGDRRHSKPEPRWSTAAIIIGNFAIGLGAVLAFAAALWGIFWMIGTLP